MKNNYQKGFLTLLLILTFNVVCFGHGSVKVRKRCGSLNNKYTSNAWVTKSLILANQYQSVSTCNPCYPVIWGGEASVSLEKCAWQKARYCGGAILSGQTLKWFCNRGGKGLLDQFMRYGLNFDDANENSFEKSNIETGDVAFKTNSIEIPSINGSLLTSGDDMETYFEVRVWICNYKTNDTVYNNANTIKYGKIGIDDKTLVKEGIFKNLSILMKENGIERTLKIENLDVKIDIPEEHLELLNSEDNSEKEIVVEIVTHGGGKNEKSFDKMIEQSNQNTNISSLNLALSYTDNNEIRINFVPIKEDTYTVRIYDINGVIVDEYSSVNFIDLSSVEILLDRAKFQKGIYLVTYEGITEIKATKMIIQ